MGIFFSEEKIKKEDNKIKNIKSRFILKKIFDNLETKKKLSLIKLNKNIMERLNINIKDYNEYFETEIEINPDNDEIFCSSIINIDDESSRKYYHIYFDDNKEEIQRNYFTSDEKIKIIKIIIDYPIKSLRGLFRGCISICSINFKKFNRNDINNMSRMFHLCRSLKELNLKNFNTNNVTDMSCMFGGCSSLKELNLINFNTENVTDMSSMFYGCSSLKELNLKNFNTNNVTYMSLMFCDCSFNVL